MGGLMRLLFPAVLPPPLPLLVQTWCGSGSCCWTPRYASLWAARRRCGRPYCLAPSPWSRR